MIRRIARTLRTTRAERGFSLIELSIYIVVFGILAAVVVGVMISMFRSQVVVGETTTAANDSQVVVAMINGEVRNARRFQVNPAKTEFSASVAGTDPAQPNAWTCVRWTVDEARGVLVRQVKPDAVGGYGAAVDMVSDVTPTDGIPYFAADGGNTTTGTLRYAFDFSGAGGSPLTVSGQMSNRVFGGASSACF